MTKAYKVEDKWGEHAVIVYADNRNTAKHNGRSELSELDYIDWVDLRCQRAPEFDDVPPGELLRAQLDAGWQWECGGCYQIVYEGNFPRYVIRGGAVYCSSACCIKELRAARERRVTEWNLIQSAVEAWPDAEVRSVWSNDHGWGASLHFPGDEYPTTRFVEKRSAA